VNQEDQRRMAALIGGHRWAALASLGSEGPECSWVAYAYEADFSGFLLHLSRLAAHTENLLGTPRASLAISEAERGDSDPQLLCRVSIQGDIRAIPGGTADYGRARIRYLERFPDAEPLFEFADFSLFRLVPLKARFIGGFGRIYSLDALGLRATAALS
jgi:hypothetical protein